MTSAASEKTIRSVRARQAADRTLEKEVITALMSLPSGRRWVWLRMAEAQVFVEDESLDPYVMAYRKGVRNQGLRLLASVTSFTPDMYIQMTRENTPVQLKDPEDVGSALDE